MAYISRVQSGSTMQQPHSLRIDFLESSSNDIDNIASSEQLKSLQNIIHWHTYTSYHTLMEHTSSSRATALHAWYISIRHNPTFQVLHPFKDVLEPMGLFNLKSSLQKVDQQYRSALSIQRLIIRIEAHLPILQSYHSGVLNAAKIRIQAEINHLQQYISNFIESNDHAWNFNNMLTKLKADDQYVLSTQECSTLSALLSSGDDFPKDLKKINAIGNYSAIAKHLITLKSISKNPGDEIAKDEAKVALTSIVLGDLLRKSCLDLPSILEQSTSNRILDSLADYPLILCIVDSLPPVEDDINYHATGETDGSIDEKVSQIIQNIFIYIYRLICKIKQLMEVIFPILSSARPSHPADMEVTPSQELQPPSAPTVKPHHIDTPYDPWHDEMTNAGNTQYERK